MNNLHSKILKSIPSLSGGEKIEAIRGMEDVLRCEGVPETGEMVFCRLVEYLRKENCLRAYEAICDALYEGALNEYDNGFDRSVILSILEGNDHPKANHILSALEGSISDKHTELIEKYGKSHGYIKNT